MTLTTDRLKELFSYSEETGFFTRIKCVRGIKSAIGKILVSNHTSGYVTVRIDGHLYYAHRLVFLYVNGRFPEMFVDHINGVKDDNRISNLRECTTSENLQNIRAPLPQNTHGFLGVHYCKYTKKFRAQIRNNGERINLGRFSNPIDAHNAYLIAKRKLHAFCTI